MSNKQLETLRARAALAGIVLVESRNDKEQPVYVGTRKALTQELASLEAVSAWLDRVAGSVPVLAGAGGEYA